MHIEDKHAMIKEGVHRAPWNMQVRNLRASKSGQPLGSGNSSSLGTGSYGGVATTLGLSPDANGLLNALITRLPPGSLSGEPAQTFEHA